MAFSTDHGMDPDAGSYYTVCDTPLGFAKTWPYNSDGPGASQHYGTGKVQPPYYSLFFFVLMAAAPAALLGFVVAEWRRDHFEQLLTAKGI
jgi:hypothetical protein